MLTMKGGSLVVKPSFRACDDSGNASRSAGCCLNVVVTIRKISSTISTSTSATMMIVGALRRLRMRKRMVRICSFPAVLPPDEIVAERLHLDGEHLDLFAEITPGDERRDGDEQADERGAQNKRDALGELGGVAQAGLRRGRRTRSSCPTIVPTRPSSGAMPMMISSTTRPRSSRTISWRAAVCRASTFSTFGQSR